LSSLFCSLPAFTFGSPKTLAGAGKIPCPRQSQPAESSHPSNVYDAFDAWRVDSYTHIGRRIHPSFVNDAHRRDGRACHSPGAQS
jgi:hypothetical protein